MSQNEFKGKVAIVTGGASGMGKADAQLLAAQGARVVVADLNEADGKAVAAGIGDKAIFMRLNVTSNSLAGTPNYAATGGGGSLTALPIIETQAGDVSAYIPTNVISRRIAFLFPVLLSKALVACTRFFGRRTGETGVKRGGSPSPTQVRVPCCKLRSRG